MRSASETVLSVPPTESPSGLEPTLARPLADTLPAAHATIDPRRYVIRSELARGGMGRISIAEDTILRRTVAIKELLSPHGPLAARFRRELALTSRLQHPSIVSIHDGGLWPTGELVYVMKLVPGESLDRAIGRRASVPERLALLPHGIAVCEAIAYAHARGIIHRDLKPANILVGEFGETVVIDWGLAKDLREGSDARLAASNDHVDAAETVDGDVMGTPAYMPPEQALGDAVDARADVYALGAVLYHMLAGAPPYTGRSAAAVLADVVDHAPASLAERAPGLPPDLLTIVAKAMARKPDDRYATARELAGDLARFQQGQLVAAHRYSTSQLVRRWVRKHRTAVAVAAVAVTTLVVGGVVSVREILQRERAAEQARGLAEQNSRDAEGLTTFMLTHLRDQLAPIGKLDLLQGVAAQVHDYYRHQPEARGAEARAGRANALRNLGDVLLARGDSAGALADYRASRELLAVQLVVTPTDGVRRDLGVIHDKLAEVQAAQGATAEALASARTSVALLAPLAASGTPQTLSDLSNAHDTVAKLLAVQGDADGALATLRTSLALAERRFALIPTDVDAARSLSITHNNVGDMLVDANPAAALVEYRESEALVEGAVAREPDDATLQRDLSISHARVGDVLLPMGDVAGALRSYRAALDIAIVLAAKDPTNADWQLDLTICHDDVGDALRAQDDVAGARAEFEGALVVKRAMAARDPHDLTVRRNLMVGLNRVGDLALDAGERAHALALFTESRELAIRIAAEDATNAEATLDLAKARDRVGKALEAAARVGEAIVEYRASLAARDAVATTDSPELQRGRWLARTRLGKALVVHRDYAEAQRVLDEAVAIQRELVVRDPEARADLAQSEINLGAALAAAGDADGARAAYREALALAAAHPDDAKLAAVVAPLKNRSGRGRAARRPASRARR